MFVYDTVFTTQERSAQCLTAPGGWTCRWLHRGDKDAAQCRSCRKETSSTFSCREKRQITSIYLLIWSLKTIVSLRWRSLLKCPWNFYPVSLLCPQRGLSLGSSIDALFWSTALTSSSVCVSVLLLIESLLDVTMSIYLPFVPRNDLRILLCIVVFVASI